MFRILHAIYTGCLRLQGYFMLLTLVGFYATLPVAITAGKFVMVPVLGGSILACVIALTYAVPRFAPGFLFRPPASIGATFGAYMLIMLAVVPFAMVIMTFAMTIAQGGAEPLSRNLSMLLALPIIVLGGLAAHMVPLIWILGRTQTPPGAHSAPPSSALPSAPPAPPVGGSQGGVQTDIRNLRHARMGKAHP